MASPTESRPESAEDRVGILADEFLEAVRRGERPTIDAYAAAHPELAAEIRRLFPALLMIEDLKPDATDATRSHGGSVYPGPGARPESLGDFRILREVGRGGMGIVYEAEQVSLGRRVALKVLAGHALDDPRRLARFEREARAAARLHHTNIVPVFGVGAADGVHYYVMQFIAGLGLDAVLDEVRRIETPIGLVSDRTSTNGDSTASAVAQSLFFDRTATPGNPTETQPAIRPLASTPTLPSSSSRHYAASVARLGLQAADALAYAHDQGILHRDIKPSNLLLDAHGTLWVADFGLAKSDDGADLTGSGDLLGTLRYMAPERFEGRSDARSDVYALGLTLYELLARRPAYQESDRGRLVAEVTRADPPRLARVRPDLPADLATIVHKAIERDPAHRYPTAAALADDLRRFLDDRPIAARPLNPAQRLARWARRNPTVAALTALSTLLAFAVVSGLVIGYGESRRRLSVEVRLKNEARFQAERAALAQLMTENRSLEVSIQALQIERTNEDLKRSQTLLRRSYYASQMNLTQRAWEIGEIGRVRSLLGSLASDERGFEWHYWNRLADSSLWTGDNGDDASCLAVSPDGRSVAVGYWNGRITLWHPGEPGFRWSWPFGPEQPTPALHALAFSPDGRVLLAAGEESFAVLLEAATGRSAGPPPDLSLLAAAAAGGPGPSADGISLPPIYDASAATIEEASFSPDASLLAMRSGDGTVRLWETATGKARAALLPPDGGPDAPPALGITFSDVHGQPTLFALQPDRTVLRWRPPFDRPAETPFRESGPNLLQARFSPGGRRVAATEAFDAGTIAVLPMPTGPDRPAPGMTRTAWLRVDTSSFAVADDGALAVGKTGSAIQVIEPGRKGEPWFLHGHDSSVIDLAFHPEGRLLLSVSLSGKVKLWAPQTSLPFRRIPAPIQVNALRFSHDGLRLLTQHPGGEFVAWDLASGWPIEARALRIQPFEPIPYVVFEPAGGRVVAIGPGRVEWAGPDRAHPEPTVIRLRPDRPISPLAHAFSQDGNHLAWAERPAEPRDVVHLTLADLAGGRLVDLAPIEIEPGRVDYGSVAVGPGGRWVAATLDILEYVVICDGASGAEVARLGVPSQPYDLRASPDGGFLAVSDIRGQVILYDTATWKPHWTLQRSAYMAVDLAFSADASRMALVTNDGVMSIWDLSSMQEVASFTDLGKATRAAFSPDGRTLAVANEADELILLDARDSTPQVIAERQASALIDERFAWSSDLYSSPRPLRSNPLDPAELARFDQELNADPHLPADVRAAARAMLPAVARGQAIRARWTSDRFLDAWHRLARYRKWIDEEQLRAMEALGVPPSAGADPSGLPTLPDPPFVIPD